MGFLSQTDYNVQVRSEIARVIDTTEQRTKIKLAEDMAISQMKNYLSSRYDLNAIFIEADQVPDTRDMFLVMTAIDLTLYHLWSKEGGNNIPQTRIDRYGDAIEWLKAVQKGAETNLPLLTNDNGEIQTDIRIWSKHQPEDNRY